MNYELPSQNNENEAEELMKILVASAKTAKKHR
jgi:hypothetical protein